MTRVDALTWVLTGTTVVASVFWVMRSDRHRTAGFELDCTSPPAAPEAVRSSPGPEGVTFRWQLDRDQQIATSYLVEAGSAPGSKNLAVVPVPRGVDTVTIPLPQGPSFARVLARNYCGTSPPSSDVRIIVP
jgi:hypothetical protein